MKRVSIAALALLLGAWVPNPPAGVSTLLSMTFLLTAPCTGGDMVYTWSINGNAGANGATSLPKLPRPVPKQWPYTLYWPSPGEAGSSFIFPWEVDDITIRGVDLVVIPEDYSDTRSPFQYLLVGKARYGDVMLALPSGAWSSHKEFPAGTGFQFPGQNDMEPLTYIDIHGACEPQKTARIFLTLLYTANGELSLPPAHPDN